MVCITGNVSPPSQTGHSCRRTVALIWWKHPVHGTTGKDNIVVMIGREIEQVGHLEPYAMAYVIIQVRLSNLYHIGRDVDPIDRTNWKALRKLQRQKPVAATNIKNPATVRCPDKTQ